MTLPHAGVSCTSTSCFVLGLLYTHVDYHLEWNKRFWLFLYKINKTNFHQKSWLEVRFRRSRVFCHKYRGVFYSLQKANSFPIFGSLHLFHVKAACKFSGQLLDHDRSRSLTSLTNCINSKGFRVQNFTNQNYFATGHSTRPGTSVSVSSN